MWSRRQQSRDDDTKTIQTPVTNKAYAPSLFIHLILTHMQYMLSTVFGTLTLAGCSLDSFGRCFVLCAPRDA